MTYTEFKKVYSRTLKRYPDASSAFDIADFCKVEKIEEVKSGKKWTQNEPSKTEAISGENYMNIVDAVPFFRNLGGVETITKTYTKYGLIPVKIVSTSPDRMTRVTRTFTFN